MNGCQGCQSCRLASCPTEPSLFSPLFLVRNRVHTSSQSSHSMARTQTEGTRCPRLSASSSMCSCRWPGGKMSASASPCCDALSWAWRGSGWLNSDLRPAQTPTEPAQLSPAHAAQAMQPHGSQHSQRIDPRPEPLQRSGYGGMRELVSHLVVVPKLNSLRAPGRRALHPARQLQSPQPTTTERYRGSRAVLPGRDRLH